MVSKARPRFPGVRADIEKIDAGGVPSAREGKHGTAERMAGG